MPRICIVDHGSRSDPSRSDAPEGITDRRVPGGRTWVPAALEPSDRAEAVRSSSRPDGALTAAQTRPSCRRYAPTCMSLGPRRDRVYLSGHDAMPGVRAPTGMSLGQRAVRAEHVARCDARSHAPTGMSLGQPASAPNSARGTVRPAPHAREGPPPSSSRASHSRPTMDLASAMRPSVAAATASRQGRRSSSSRSSSSGARRSVSTRRRSVAR